MEDEIKPPRSVSFFKWLLLVFAILTTLSLLNLIMSVIRPGPGPFVPLSFVVLSAVASPLFLTAFLALQKRKRYGRWLACFSFAFGACNVIWGTVWYFFVRDGPNNIFATGLVVGFEIVQFVLLGWGALTFAFPPNVTPEGTLAESQLPPPPPTFDD